MLTPVGRQRDTKTDDVTAVTSAVLMLLAVILIILLIRMNQGDMAMAARCNDILEEHRDTAVCGRVSAGIALNTAGQVVLFVAVAFLAATRPIRIQHALIGFTFSLLVAAVSYLVMRSWELYVIR